MFDFEQAKRDLAQLPPAATHVKLRQAIQAQISAGTLRPGDPLPSEREIKERLNLSRTTIRQAFAALTSAGLLKSVPSKGTFVTEPRAASSAVLIGLVVSGPNFHFFYPQLADAFSRCVRKAGYGLVMGLHNDSADSLLELADHFVAQNVVALAVTPPRFGKISPFLQKIGQLGLPCIFIGRRSPGISLDSISTNNEEVGYSATRHLIELGHRRIFHLGFSDYSTGLDRLAGYNRAMREEGLEPRVVEIPMREQDVPRTGTPTEHVAEPAYRIVKELWQGGSTETPTAIFCFNDITAMGTYRAFRELNVRVPEDVSIISVDDLPTVQHFEVPFSTFALPSEEIGCQGAQLLLQRLEGDTTPARTILLPARFVERASASVPRTS
jgi:DNA-binding LacI/PurR family transcriptional regulator